MVKNDIMPLSEYIINDIKPISVTAKIRDVQKLFSQLTYSHFPVIKNGVFIGSISETDAHCFESDKSVEDYLYAVERFNVWQHTLWLDVLEAFAQNDANIMAVLDEENKYLGYH